MLEDGPSLAEQGKPAFSLEAEAAQQGVPGAGAGGEFLVSAGVFHGDVYADSGAFVAAVGEGCVFLRGRLFGVVSVMRRG